MAIKSYNSKADYNAAVKPTTESQVSMIETTREIIVDGVNVVTTQPTVGDVVFLDDQNKVIYVKGGEWIQKANIPAAWTHVGYVYFRKGKQVGVVHKTGADVKWLDVCQYAITAISSTTLAIKLRMSPDYAVDTTVDVELTSTNIDATSAAEISAAVAAKATAVGDTKAWWAYLADAQGNKVDSDGTQIIIQCDTCVDYRFYIVSATGCTISHITWGDMPENNNAGFRASGRASDQRIMNDARGAAYYSTNGATPSADVPLNAAGTIVKKSEFDSSPYCKLLRDTYGTYQNYIHEEYRVVYPQHLGAFSLLDGAAMTEKYARMTAPTKAGGEKYKYPALYYGYNQSFGVDGLDFGDWHLPGVLEGCYLMDDVTLAALSPSISKMGTTAINNSTHRWFAQRYSVYSAWYFNGSNGYLGSSYVYYSIRCQAVALLEID